MATLLVLVQVAAAGITAGRAQSLAGLAVALLGAIVGGLALARTAGSRRRLGVVALAAGLVGVILSARHLATATGAIGTGSGTLGAIVALLVALLATALGGRAIRRAHPDRQRAG